MRLPVDLDGPLGERFSLARESQLDRRGISDRLASFTLPLASDNLKLLRLFELCETLLESFVFKRRARSVMPVS